MVKLLTRWIGYGLFALVLASGVLALYLHLGVRDASWAKAQLERALNPPGAPYKIAIGEVRLDWRKPGSFGDINVSNMVVQLADATVVATVPLVTVTVDPLGFLPGRPGLDAIILNAPKLYLSRSAEGVVGLGFDAEGGRTLPVADLVAFFTAGDNPKPSAAVALPFRRLFIENAGLYMREGGGVKAFLSTPFTARIGKTLDGRWEGVWRMPFSYGGKPGRIDATLEYSLRTLGQTLDVGLQQVPAELACQLGACPSDVAVSGLVTGRVTLAFSRNYVVHSGKATVKLTRATIDAPKAFAEPLALREGSFFASIGKHARNIELRNMVLHLPDTSLAGTVQFFSQANDWRLVVNASASKLAMNKLYKYWPVALAPQSREAVTRMIKAGHAEHGQIKLNITKAMHDANRFPASAVEARVLARDLTVEYLPGFPLLKQANGTVYFIGNGMRAELESATLLSATKVNHSVLTADDLHHARAPMVATIHLSGEASDVVKFLQIEHFTFDEPWQLNAKTIQGAMDATIKLGFDSFSEESSGRMQLDNVEYAIGATLKDVSQPKVLGSFDIKGLSGQLDLDNQHLDFNGTLKFNDATSLNVALTQNEQGSTSATFSGAVPRAQFAALGLPDRSQFGDGNLGIEATVGLGKGTATLARATLNLGDIALNVPELSWQKPRGEPGALRITPAGGAGNFTLNVNARDLLVENGSLTLDQNQQLQALTLPRVVTDKNDFSLRYATAGDGYKVNLQGKRLDAQASYAQSENGLLADFPPIALEVDLAELVLAAQSPIKNLKGTLNCGSGRCESANLTAQTGKSAIKASITKPAGKRQLVISASDAGDFLRALDVTDRLFGGKFELRGGYNETKQPAPFNGRVLITNFNLKNSEILGRILSVASISGLTNMLTGSGIAFEKLSANLSHEKGVVRVSKGLASGASLGITVQGMVDTNTTKLDMNGTLAPAYLLNSIFGRIPIIKELVGKEEGLIAFSYTVGGTYAAPEVSVNPLSGLTPGFLRGIFTAGTNDSQTYPGEGKPTEKKKE